MAGRAQAKIPHAEKHPGKTDRAAERRERGRPRRTRRKARHGGGFIGRGGAGVGSLHGFGSSSRMDGMKRGQTRAAVQRVLERELPQRTEMPLSARPLSQESVAVQSVYPRVLRSGRGQKGVK